MWGATQAIEAQIFMFVFLCGTLSSHKVRFELVENWRRLIFTSRPPWHPCWDNTSAVKPVQWLGSPFWASRTIGNTCCIWWWRTDEVVGLVLKQVCSRQQRNGGTSSGVRKSTVDERRLTDRVDREFIRIQTKPTQTSNINRARQKVTP